MRVAWLLQHHMIATYDSEYKIVLVGDQSVGKSSIIRRFIDETYEEILLASIGVTFTHKIITLDGKMIKLNLYDLSGQQKFHSIAPCIYSHSHALILCFDVTNTQSYDNLCAYWYKQLENHNRSHCDIFILGNKIDAAERKVEEQRVNQFAKDNHIKKIYYVSAKENINVEETFQDLARFLLNSQAKEKDVKEEEHCKLTHKHFENQESRCYKN